MFPKAFDLIMDGTPATVNHVELTSMFFVLHIYDQGENIYLVVKFISFREIHVNCAVDPKRRGVYFHFHISSSPQRSKPLQCFHN